MKLRFIGQYTNGRDSITLCGVTFHGREPSELDGEEAFARLPNHPEFEVVTASDAPVRQEVTAPEPKRRGRPRKV